jgi:hypothetical protein
MSLEDFADAFFSKNERGVSTAYGTVLSVNADGSYQVKMSATGDTRCAKLCDAEVGDTVMVLIQANGHCAALGRVGGAGGGVSVLYEGSSTGTITLSQSAANFDYMRIYFKKGSDSEACATIDLYHPDGKRASLVIANPYASDATQILGRTVTVSGTSITPYRNEFWANGASSISGGTTSSLSIYITRVEAWNEPQLRNSRSGGGGGEGHTYALSGSGATISLTEDGSTSAGSHTIPSASSSAAGLMSSAHYSKLEGLEAMTLAEAQAGTSTTARTISAKVLSDLLDSVMPNAVQSGSNLAVE